MIRVTVACIAIFFSISEAFALEMKLECPIAIKKEYSTGSIERINEVIILDVHSANGITSVKGAGELSILLATKKTNYIDNFTDASDSGKWEIYNESANLNNHVRIDRNTGEIFYNQQFRASTGGFINTTVTGNCVKVDTSKRKF